MKIRNNYILLLILCSLQVLSLILLCKCLYELSSIDKRTEKRFHSLQMELLAMKMENDEFRRDAEKGKQQSKYSTTNKAFSKEATVVREYIYQYER